MPRIIPTVKFEKSVGRIKARDRVLFARIVETLKRCEADIRHPGLNFEKVTNRNYCTIRVTRAVRIALRENGPDAFELIDIGDHDAIYRRQI